MKTFRDLPHKSVLSLAWPMVLSNISVPLLGIVDTAILGHLPSPVYLAAVALGASLLSILFWGLGFLRMGTTSLVAQAHGRQDTRAMQALLVRSCLLALVLGVLLICLRTPILDIALQLMQPSADIAPFARHYSEIRIFSAPLVLANMVILGWFIGRQNTRAPLIILVSTNLLNLLLDMVFIWGFKLNSEGAALATVCADILGFALAVWLVTREIPAIKHVFTTYFSLQLRHYRALLLINQHLFIRTLCLLLTISFFIAQGAQLGDTTLATNAIIFQLLMLTSYGLDGIAHASEAIVGSGVGQKNQQRVRDVILATGLWSLCIASAMTIFFALSQSLLIPLFTNIEPVVISLSHYYLWVIALPLLCVGGFWLDGVFIGAGQTKIMQYAMLFCSTMVFFPTWWFTQQWGNHGLWFAFATFSLARGISLAICLPHLYQSLSQRDVI